MRTNVALAVLLFVLGACMAPHARERQQPEPASGERQDEAPLTVRLPRSRATEAPGAAASSDLRRLMLRPLPWDPVDRIVAMARDEARRLRPRGFLGEAPPPRIGKVQAVIGARVAVRFESDAVAHSLESRGAYADVAGYHGEVEFFLCDGSMCIGHHTPRQGGRAVQVGDLVAVQTRRRR